MFALGNLLTAEQSKALWQMPDEKKMIGKRDRSLLSIIPQIFAQLA